MKNPRYSPSTAASNMNVVYTLRKLARTTPLKYPTANTARNPHPSDRKVARKTPANATSRKMILMGQSPGRPTAGGRSSAGFHPTTRTLSDRVRGNFRDSDSGAVASSDRLNNRFKPHPSAAAETRRPLRRVDGPGYTATPPGLAQPPPGPADATGPGSAPATPPRQLPSPR